MAGNYNTTSMSRRWYYIPWSSWFDNNYTEYDKDKMKDILLHNKVSIIRTERMYGWDNQPEVITFYTSQEKAKIVEEKLKDAFETWWILVWKKDWHYKKQLV